MAGWDEASLHRWLGERLPGTRVDGVPRGHVHDAAVLELAGGRLAVCTDRCEEGVHADLGVDAAALGRKAAARTLSDLAATAARPVGLLLALAAGPDQPEARLRAALEGLIAEGARHGAPLVGGDLTARPGPLSLAVTALGEAPADPPGRDRGRPGDLVLVTGPLGGSRAGRHLAIEPRLATGRALHAAGVRAMLDLSDGLALDLSRLARLSGVVARLEDLPAHPDALTAAGSSGRDPRDHVLFDGEDHELVAAGPPAAVQAFLAGPDGAGCSLVGRLEEPAADRAPGLLICLDDIPVPFDPADPRAYVHGR